jgi:alpha-glucosidase
MILHSINWSNIYSYLILFKQTGNHDNPRVATRFGNELVDAINMITLLLPGTAITYNGEEVGMEDTDVSWKQTKDTAGINAGPAKYKLFSRDPERTPMQWNAGMNAGLSNHNP